MKIILANKYEDAAGMDIDATVEAEYGEQVIEGKEYTLAHHCGKYRGHPAPCEFPNQQGFDGVTLISHIDLDTIGGCLELYGLKPEDKAFWKGAGFIDVKGPHHIHELDEEVQAKLQAYRAYSNSLERIKSDAPRDVTKDILAARQVIDDIIAGDENQLRRGEEWRVNAEAAIEANLVYENEYVRAFVTNDVFCSAAYYSKTQDKVIPAVVSYNKRYNSVTVSFEDGGERFEASTIVKELWGDMAGGHAGIAGSPRGWDLTMEEAYMEFVRASRYVEILLTQLDK